MAEMTLAAVRKTFGASVALHGLDLTVEEGEFVVLLGPTGAGKTTTLRLVAGLEQPTSGRVRIGGEDVTRLPPAARDVAFVFQQYSLYPHYTVYDNLAFPLRSPMHRLPEPHIRERIAQVAAMLRIEDKLGSKATALSGGQMQRVALGRALVRQPNGFLMDEPLSSLDAKLREDLRVELKRIQRELGATILYVTHDDVEALTLADRIGVLEEGRLLQLAPPRAVYVDPANVRVARRLGSPSINLIPAALLPHLAPAGADKLGVRPEDVQLATAADGLRGTVQQVAHAGAETVVLVETAGQLLRAMVSGTAVPEPGSPVDVTFRREAILSFDAQGNRLAM